MIKALFKIQFASAYRTIFFRTTGKTKARKPTKTILIALLALYVCASLMFSVGTMFFQLAKGLIPLNLGWVYFANIGVMAFGMSVIFTIFMSQTMLFEAKDNELLLSLPVKPSHILGSRLLVLWTLDFVTSLLFLLPAGAIYAYLANPPAMFYVMFLAAAILIPFLGLTIAALFGYIISAITSRMRNKSLLVTVFSFALMGLYLWGYYWIVGGVNKLAAMGATIGEAIQKSLPPFYYFGMALDKLDVVAIIYFVLWCVIPFAFIYMWLSKGFIGIATTKRQAKKLEYKEGKLEKRTVFVALLKKEMSKFLNTPIYLLNCGLSFILNIAFGVFFFIKGPAMLNGMVSGNVLEGVDITSSVAPLVIAVLCFTSVMALTTAPSISLEGKHLWILRSNPINVKDIFKAKISLNLLFGFVTLLIADILIIYTLKPALIDALLIILIPLSVQTFTALEGLISNLLFPKFNAVNDAMAVKQSASVIVAMLVSFALMALLVMGYMLLSIPFAVFGLGAFIFINLLNIIAYRFIMTRGVKIFNNF